MDQILELILHPDAPLDKFVSSLGPWFYGLLFLVIFCETGLVVTPILPGDSLLFAVGAVAAHQDANLSIGLLMVLLAVAAVVGDAVNYAIGAYIGPRVFRSERSRLFNREHLMRAHRFYERYGGKTILLARFIPIIRTFAPFVAGIGQMSYVRFAAYNVVGGVFWVAAFLAGGYWLGNMPVVKRYFHIVIAAIIVISVLPAVVELLLARRRTPEAEPVGAGRQ